MITLERGDAAQTADSSATPQQEIHLSEYFGVILKRRRLLLIVMVLAVIIEGIHTVMTKPMYRAQMTLLIERERPTPADISNVNYFTYDAEFMPTQLRLMTSTELLKAAGRRLNQPRLPATVQVNPIPGTNLVQISAVAADAKLAADSANALAEAYIDWRLESKQEFIGAASELLTSQIEQLKGEIERKEEQLQAYGRSKDIVADETGANVTMQSLQTLNNNYSTAMADRVTKESRYRELVASRDDLVSDALNSPLVTQAKNDQAKLERDYAEKLNLYKPEWPAMQQLKAQIEKGRQHVDAAMHEAATKAREMAKADYLTALRREESLKSVVQRQKNAALTVNGDAVEYNNLKVELDTKRALLDTLVKRSAATQLSAGVQRERQSNIRVIERATPPAKPFEPSYKDNILFALLFGIGGGIALAFFLEYLDRSLRTVDQVERALRLPALGIVPAVGLARRYGYGRMYGYSDRPKTRPKTAPGAPDEKVVIELLPHQHPRSSVAEAYRAFRTSLLLSRAGGVKTIAITSSVPAEGKTATAVNLAVVLGQLGRRVLLVDADLHKPRLHEVIHVSNRVGLVSILAENVPASDAIIKTPLPNVFAVPSGPSSPNPSGLLSSVAMKKFLDFVAGNFDHIIIDTPPVSLIADALMIGSVIDGVVLTIRGGKTPREQVSRVRDRLLRSNVRILGALINNLEEEEPQGKYYAYYGYQDGRPNAAAPASRSA